MHICFEETLKLPPGLFLCKVFMAWLAYALLFISYLASSVLPTVPSSQHCHILVRCVLPLPLSYAQSCAFRPAMLPILCPPLRPDFVFPVLSETRRSSVWALLCSRRSIVWAPLCSVWDQAEHCLSAAVFSLRPCGALSERRCVPCSVWDQAEQCLSAAVFQAEQCLSTAVFQAE